MRARLLPALAVGAALWVVAVSAVAAGLSALGWWSPWLAWPVAVARGGRRAGGACACSRGVRMPVAASVALVAVVVGFAVWAGATHSEQVLPRRDAASNLQAAVSLATTHSRVVPVDPDVGRRIRGARPAGGDPGEPGVLRGGVERGARRCSRSSSSGRRWSTPSAGGPGEPRSRCVLPAAGDGPGAAGPRAARRPGRRTVGGGRDGGASPASSSRCCTPRGRRTPSRWRC